MTIYAIVETGGKQYKVSPGQKVRVESLAVAEGGTVELDRVLAIGDGEKLTMGKPTIEGAKVVATAKGQGLGEKVAVYKYKAKVRYSKKTGHRQPYTELQIESIAGPGTLATEKAEKPAAKPRRRTTTKKEVTENGS